MRLTILLGLLTASTAAFSQTMLEYGLAVGKGGAAGVAAGTKGKQAVVPALQKTSDRLRQAGRGGRQQQVSVAAALEDEAARNRQALAATAGEGGSELHVKGPAGTVISLDRHVVGRGTASLKLAPGSYRVRIAGPAYVTWEEQVQLEAGASRTLEPKMERPASTSNVIQIGPKS
jgi:hypothetical protein